MTAYRATFRVEWLPGSDTLQGTCFCGAANTAQDPATMLDWLAAHPVGHDRTTGPVTAPKEPEVAGVR